MKLNKLDIVTAITYFFQGCLGLVGLAIPFYYKSLGFTVAQIATIGAIAGFPWYIKIIFGMISDNYPILGMRRKPYFIISAFISLIGWFLLLTIQNPTYWMLVGCASLYTLGYCLRDVVIDAKIAEHSKKDADAKHYQVISLGYRALGAVITGVVGGLLIDKFGFFIIFKIMCFIQLLLIGTGFLIHDIKTQIKQKIKVIKALINPIKEYMKTPQLRILTLFLILGMFSPGLGDPLKFYLKSRGISITFMGWLLSIGSGSAVIGAIIYNKFFKHLKIKQVLYTSVIIGACTTFSVWFYYIKWFAILNTVIFGIVGMILAIPLMTLFMKLASQTKHKGTTYAIIASVSNITGAVAFMVGGWLYDKIGFFPLICVSSVTTFLCYPVIKYIREE